MRKFWKKEEMTLVSDIEKHCVPEKIPEKSFEQRGYFDTVAKAEASVPVYGINAATQTVTTPDLAMKVATAFRCVSILSGSIAALPLELKRKKGCYFGIDEDDPINYALNVRPNHRLSAFELKRNAIALMLNHGNAYIYPDWVGGELRLILLSPYSVSYDKIMDEYMVNDTVNNIYTTLSSDEIIHLKGFSLDGGYTGVSVIHFAGQTLGIGTGINKKSLSDQQPGSSLRGFISGDYDSARGITNLQDDQIKPVVERIRSELRSGETVTYLQGDLKFNPMSLTPADLQTLEMMKLNVLELCRFYGVHPDKAFAGQSQNYKASEMSQVQFMADTLNPLLRQIENEFFIKLIPRKLSSKYKLMFDLESFYQTDLETMSTFMEKTVQNGLYTHNEWRAKRDMPPVKGGDTPFVSCNTAPIDSLKIKGENISQSTQNLPPKNDDTPVG